MSLVPEADAQVALTTLRPAAHRDRFIHLQTAARSAGGSDPAQRLNTIIELLQHYRNAAGLGALLPHDWDLYLALESRLAAASAPLNSEALHALFELHKNATLQYQSRHLIVRYISLVLAYFSRINGVEVAATPALADDPSSSAAKVSDPALKWTSLESCPTFDTLSGAYVVQSLPALSTDASHASAWEAVCGLDAVRSRLREAYAKCAYQLQESQSVWRPYLAFEEALLNSPHIARDQQVEAVRQVYLARLKVPHAAIDDTFQAFSQFVTQHLPPHQYESEMSAANTLVAESRSMLRQREQFEDALTPLLASGSLHVPGSRQDVDSFATYCKPYLRWQTGRAKRAARSKDRTAHTELDLACALYERLIAVFGLHPPTTHREELVYYAGDLDGAAQSSKQWKRLSNAERAARTQQEEQLLGERLSLATDLWLDYIALLTSGTHPDASLVMDVCTRAVHCLPTAVSLHAALMRSSARFRRSRAQVEQLFERVATPGALSLTAAELTDLTLARVDCERELATYELVVKAGAELDMDPAHDMDKFTEIYALLSYALGKVAEAGEGQYDTSLQLERVTVNWVERAVHAMGGPASEGGAGFNELAEQVWQTAVTQQPDNLLVYREAAAYWLRRFDARKARGWLKAGASKVERRHAQGAGEDAAEYQALLNDWLQLEHQYGSIEEIEHAETKARAERQRALEAWYASYAQYGYAQGGVAENGAAANGTDGTAMQVEAPQQPSSTSAGKRKADDDVVLEDTPIADAPMATRADDTAAAGGEGAAEQKKTRTGEESAPARDREHCSVLVAGLEPSTDAQAVRSLLRGCGRIVELSGPTVLTRHDGTSEAAALVEFADASGAASALTRHGKPLGATHVSVHIGWKCTLFVTNFAEEWTDADVRSAFGAHGLVFNVRWPSKRFVTTRRFCYVQYTTPSSASAAVAALDGSEVAEGRRMSVAHSDPSRRKARTDAVENAHELFVSGFARNITDDDMRTYFEAYGKVTGVRLLRTPEGSLRGIGFVDFENALEAQRAMRELNSTKWRGKTIAVTMAEHRSAHGAKPHRREDVAERRTRSVRVQGLPEDAQEALIQQALEQAVGLGSVAQVLWTPGEGRSAVVAFGNQADAGKAVLLAQTGEVRYADQPLDVVAMDEPAPKQEPHALAFVPRASRGRGRGRARAFAPITHAVAPAQQAEDDMQVEPAAQPSGQDRFRAMLNTSHQ
ncbi:RNA-binding protein Prp24 [Moesziomyces antarcticus]|uniref:U4/U6 snRNA-associated-splicing factor PRP24 n=2 Tax=Pseudozyma antarctica TaxID=84753 RepID=A0A081CBP2_PSEA2|nr:RNA-binding protein Prp24 [Moesziomyces antarcticus]GAK64088.1 RNA-binding protein Prp24 [Moesziomyces antarcticus]SPO44693.1 uncharacterized protein PSANT_02379 [Moesziomyces antarcticus]